MTIAQNAATPHAALLSRGVKIAGTILVLGLALAQVDLSGRMISALFQILFAAIVFALALAFGLGCKELARDAVAKIIQNLREKRGRTAAPISKGEDGAPDKEVRPAPRADWSFRGRDAP